METPSIKNGLEKKIKPTGAAKLDRVACAQTSLELLFLRLHLPKTGITDLH